MMPWKAEKVHCYNSKLQMDPLIKTQTPRQRVTASRSHFLSWCPNKMTVKKLATNLWAQASPMLLLVVQLTSSLTTRGYQANHCQ
jgi:hypothetical protein